MAKVNSVCTSEKVDHKGASEYVRAYNAHCPYVAREATILRPPKTTALDEALESRTPLGKTLLRRVQACSPSVTSVRESKRWPPSARRRKQ